LLRKALVGGQHRRWGSGWRCCWHRRWGSG
jgi:hypothetical protein